MDLTPEQIQLIGQRTREANVDNMDDPNIIWIDRQRVYEIEKKIPIDKLLLAVQKYELKDKQKAQAGGYRYTGCSYDNPNGEILGGSFGHVLEHAICNILDLSNSIPPSEVTSGSTIADGINTDKPFDPKVINHHYKVAIIPAPSLDMQQSRTQVGEIINKLENYNWDQQDINLDDIY